MSQALVQALQNPALYDHSVDSFEVIETHISWVILTGPFAYKIKKPNNFGFLDFSTLEKRQHFCNEELRLNRRLAPELYLEVLPICGSEQSPQWGTDSEAIEYAIKMVQFPQDQLLDKVLQRGQLTKQHIDEIAMITAAFHQRTESAEENTDFGSPAQVMAPVQQNFDQIRDFLREDSDLAQLSQIEGWAQDMANILNPVFEQRKREGMVKACHGDLHLGNITLFNGKVTLFDCIEFNDSFRWIDVMSEAAFFIMDLEDRGLPTLANRFLNAYLEQTGDYSGLRVLNFYKSYRAVVRAKVALFNLYNENLSDGQRDQIFKQYRSYMQLAEHYMEIPNRYILLMHGFSGSGKTSVSTALVDQLGAIRLRSDVERKRLFDTNTKQQAGINDGIYSHRASEKTFDHLVSIAEQVLFSGHAVIVDATFLQQAYRDLFHQLAENCGVPLQIVSCELDDTEIRARLQQRQATGTDPSDATIEVYEAQLLSAEPLNEEELKYTHHINTASMEDTQRFIEMIQAH